MLHLPNVTLCCVDTRSVPQALQAVQQCTDKIRFGRVLFFGPDKPSSMDDLPHSGSLQWHAIAPLRSITDYNRFMLRDLCEHVQTSHALIVQWDGYISAPDLWRSDFLEWDYIGAPWYHRDHPGLVGNGGFSLRSKKLLTALLHLPTDWTQPEDREICVNQRAALEQAHGIRFAPLETAESFACEYGTYRRCFGFHGMHNFAHIMDSDGLARWLSEAPPDLLTTKHARKLIKELIRTDRRIEARSLLRQRSQITGWSQDQCILYLRTFLI